MFIRHFEPSDAEALAVLFHTSVQQLGSRHYTSEQLKAWSASKPDPQNYLRRASDRSLLVAIDSMDTVAGYGDLEPDGHIDHIYCRPDLAGTGVGSAVYRAIEVAGRRAGIEVLFVEASEGSRRLFARHGFVTEGRNDFCINGVAIHNYRMSKRLNRR